MTLPLWTVWHPGGGEAGPHDGQTFLARDAEDAAEQWAENYERCDCEYTLDETPEIVKVCLADDYDNVKTFRVGAQISRTWYATLPGENN